MRLLAIALALGSCLALLPPVAATADPPSATAVASADEVVEPPLLEWELVSRRPHDTGAWTQGLLLDGQGRLFESTGSTGPDGSTLREVDPDSGEVLRERRPPTDEYSEGLALVGDELVQITWKDNVARRYDLETFEITGGHAYEGQGWGLCHDGQRLVMSDGSDRLTFRDPQSFETGGMVEVTLGGEPLTRLNELECVDGMVWSNVLGSDAVVRIDPAAGAVTGVLDLRPLRDLLAASDGSGGSLNGIAYDRVADTYLVTGKLWSELFEIRLLEAG
jgi:glutamine cyclotransferase